MQFAAIATLAAAAVATVNAQTTCNTTIIASLLTSDDVTTCSTDSGYDFTSLTAPTAAEVTAMCGDAACLAALSALESSGLGDCTVGSFSIMTDLVDPIVASCNDTSATGSSSGASTTTVGTSSASGSDDTVETQAPAASSSGSAAAPSAASASASGSVSASASSSGAAITVTSALVGSVLLVAAINA